MWFARLEGMGAEYSILAGDSDPRSYGRQLQCRTNIQSGITSRALENVAPKATAATDW